MSRYLSPTISGPFSLLHIARGADTVAYRAGYADGRQGLPVKAAYCYEAQGAWLYTNGHTDGVEIAEMLGWIEDCWGDDIPADLTDAEILSGVERHYEGGVLAFRRDMA